MQNDPLTRYLASDAEPVTLHQVVTSYGEHLLGEAASADLLFQVDDFAAAALCYRRPEQLAVSAQEDQPEHEATEVDRMQKLDKCFTIAQCEFLQAHGPYIYLSLIGVHPDMQRRGLGGQLLAMICSVADREKKWCYLEGSHQGVGLYIKHGFVVFKTSQLGPTAPLMNHMARPPQ